MSMRSRRVLTARAVGAALAFPALLAVGAPSATAAEPTAQTSRSCKAPNYPGSGYFTSLSVTRTGCSRGKSVALAHYRCRVKRGRAGRCTSRVLGYRCSERRNSIPTEINARVTCRRSSAKVVFTYQQNT